MDKKKEALCSLGGRNLYDAISTEADRTPEEKSVKVPSLHTLAGTQFSSVINQVSENLAELDNALKDPKNDKKMSSLCTLGGRQLSSIINDMIDISENLGAIEKALAVIGNGSTQQGLKQLSEVSAAVEKARKDYPSSVWKEAGQEGVEKAFLAKIKEAEAAYLSGDRNALLAKADELEGMNIRMKNKEWL